MNYIIIYHFSICLHIALQIIGLFLICIRMITIQIGEIEEKKSFLFKNILAKLHIGYTLVVLNFT